MTVKGILDELREGRLTLEQARSRLQQLQAPGPLAAVQEAPQTSSNDIDDIAIISMAGRFPRAASVEQFWDNLRAGVDGITEVPKGRWDPDQYFSAQKGAPGKAYCRWGGFIDDVDRFDPVFFGISPREAQLMDPQERLLLQVAWTLFERIGYTRAYLGAAYGGEVGVFTGSMYQQYHAFDTDLPRKAAIAMSSNASMANRISHFFNLSGPSLALDTMCSSAATALHLACESLRHGTCRMALVGAANLSIHPFKYIALCQAQLLASDPSVRAFGQTDGFLPGEVVGAVLLKPLRQAIADGDPIVALIKSSAVSHKGYTPGFSVPSAEAVQNLLTRHFQAAGVDAATVDYVETSASGADLGDVAEFQALRAVYGQRHAQLPLCHTGSVKSNIGHAEAAIGIAQLIKVACQLRDKVRVPSIWLDPLNPGVRADEVPLRAQRSLEPWAHPSDTLSPTDWATPRRAAIHTFAAGGSNAHILLEEYRPAVGADEPLIEQADSGPWLLVFSAATPERLQRLVEEMRQALAALAPVNLGDLAHTLAEGREALACRIAWVLPQAQALDDSLREAGAFLAEPHGGLETARFQYAYLDALDPLAAAPRVSLTLDEQAAAWVRGEISLQSARGASRNGGGRRILALPTYPFANQLCWLPVSVPTSLAESEPAPEATAAELLDDSIETLVREQIGALTQIEPQALQLGKALLEYGLNSVTMMVLSSCLCQAFAVADENRDGSRLAQCRTASEMITLLAGLAPDPVAEPAARDESPLNLAAPVETPYIASEHLQLYHRNGYAFAFANDAPAAIASLSAGKRGVVVGAGPAGLVAALTLAANGYDEVLVVEKRTAINRMQMVTLYRHTLPYLKRIGVLDAVVRRASPIARHDFYLNMAGRRTRYYSRQLPPGVLDSIDPQLGYGDEAIAELFVGESVMAISLADLQDVLMDVALARGVRFMADRQATVVADERVENTWQLLLGEHGHEPSRRLGADLLVLADGARSQVAQAAGIDYGFCDSTRAESWYVYHCASRLDTSWLNYEFSFDQAGHLDHCAFGLAYPRRNEFGVAFYSSRETLPELALFNEKADFFARSWGVGHDGMNWLTQRIEVRQSLAQRVQQGNLLLVGDAAGTGSPNAGLGSGLAISAYGWALDEYCRRARHDREAAGEFYQTTASRYPLAWQQRSALIWDEILGLAGSPVPAREIGRRTGT